MLFSLNQNIQEGDLVVVFPFHGELNATVQTIFVLYKICPSKFLDVSST